MHGSKNFKGQRRSRIREVQGSDKLRGQRGSGSERFKGQSRSGVITVQG